MLLSRRIDDKEIQLKNQSLIYFQISGAGHEAVLTAAGLHLRAGYDWFYPYYRDRALCLTLGMTSAEMLLAAVGATDDPNSGGRQMPSHWGHRRLNIPSQGSPTGTQCLHAIGAGEAGMIFERVTRFPIARITFIPTRSPTSRSAKAPPAKASSGSPSTPRAPASCRRCISWKTTATRSRSRSKCRPPGGDISRLVESFPNLKLLRCDGTDFLESYRTLGEAVAWVRRERKPAFVHAKVVRPVLALALGR